MKANVVVRNLEARRFSEAMAGQLRVQHDVQIQQVDPRGTDGLTVRFSFATSYASVGMLRIEGDVLLSDVSGMAAVVDAFRATQRLEGPLMQGVLGAVMNHCIPQAVLLAREIRLPAPVPMPQPGQAAPAAGKSEPQPGMDAA